MSKKGGGRHKRGERCQSLSPASPEKRVPWTECSENPHLPDGSIAREQGRSTGVGLICRNPPLEHSCVPLFWPSQPHLQTIWCYHRSSSKFTNSRGENTPLHWHTYPSTSSVYHSARTLRRWPFWSRLRILSGMNQFTSVQLALQNDDTEFMNLQSCESCSFFLNLQ